MKASRLSSVRPMFTCRHMRGKQQQESGHIKVKITEKEGPDYINWVGFTVVLTYKGSPSRTPFTREKQGYCSTENTADRARTIPYSFPKWHDGKLHIHTKTESDDKDKVRIRELSGQKR